MVSSGSILNRELTGFVCGLFLRRPKGFWPEQLPRMELPRDGKDGGVIDLGEEEQWSPKPREETFKREGVDTRFDSTEVTGVFNKSNCGGMAAVA